MHPKLIQVAKAMARWPVVGPCIRHFAKYVRRSAPQAPAALSAPDTQENLLQSIPVSLRHLERELQLVRAQLTQVAKILNRLNPQNQSNTASTHAPPAAFVQVASTDKLATTYSSGLKLAFGTDFVGDGAIVINDQPQSGVDVLTTTWNLPFQPNLATNIRVGEWLQRHSMLALQQTALPTLFRLLAPGGELEICVLDASALLKNPKANLRSLNGKVKESHRCAESVEPIDILETGEPRESDERDETKETKEPIEPQTLFTRESLEGLLNEAGFTNVTVAAEPSTAMLQAIATKPQ